MKQGDISTEGIFQTTQDGRYLNANPALARMFGYQSPAELITTVTNIERQTFVSAESAGELKRLLATQDHALGFEAERYRKDGGRFWTSINARTVRDAGGALLYYEGTVRDITERKAAESALRENERKLRLIVENTTDVIFAFDMNRRPVYANPAVEKLTGYTFAEIQEQRFINRFHPDDQERMLKHWEELFAGKAYSDIEFRLRTKTGQIKWCSSTWGPLLDENNRQIGVQGRERDITELRRFQAVTRELAAIVENSSDGIISTTLDQRIVSWNKSAERMIGYGAGEAMGQFISVLAPSEGAVELQQILSDLAAGQTVESFETVLRRKDGSRICVFLSVSPILDATGKVTGASAIARDITERKRLENEIAGISASERRRLSHELHDGLGQYLAGLAFRAKALEQALAGAGVPYAQEAKDIVALISNAMAQTRSLARGLDPIGIETIGLVAALQILAAETEAIFNLTCRFQYADTILSVDTQKALALYRIVQEAIHNAITHGEARQITIELAMDTECLCLRVQDDGTGFAAGTGNLTGMGLRVMQYRARAIGARLEINSQINHGTEIRCLLPRAACFPVAPDGGTGA